MSDFGNYMAARERTQRYRAEYDAASVRLEKAIYEERMAEVISQHEPVASVGIDRDQLRVMLRYIQTGRTTKEAEK